MPTLKLAILGAGNVAESYVRQIRRLREDGLAVELVAICSRSSGPVSRLAAKFGIPSHGTDYAELLARRDVAGVLILTPMRHHRDHVRLALEAGKHVLVEKTMASSADDGKALAKLAESRSLSLVSAPFTTLSPTFRDSYQRVASGEIGQPLSCRALYGWAGPDWADWFHDADAGPLRDLGVYGLTTLTGLLGPVRSVIALGRHVSLDGRFEPKPSTQAAPNNFQLSLTFVNGCLGVLTTGFVQQKYKVPGIEIYGSSGTLQFIGQDWDPQGYEIWTRDGGCWSQYEASETWPWTDGVRDFCQSILDGREPDTHPSHVIHVLEIIDRAMESLKSLQVENVGSDFQRLALNPPQLDCRPSHNHNPLTLT